MTSHDFLESELKRRTRFQILVHRASCNSTQDLANDDLTDRSEEPVDAVFWADQQTRGRGRQERTWAAAPGLDLTATLRVTAQLTNPLALAAALPVAVMQACEPLAGQPLRIKWPNDIYAGSRKLAGVLIDRDTHQPATYRIGVGINVNRTEFPGELSDTATSLQLLNGKHHDLGAILLALAEHVDAMVADICTGNLTERERLFAERLGLLGEQVQVQAKETVYGRLTAINFERLVLDGQIQLPLALVRSLLPAPQ